MFLRRETNPATCLVKQHKKRLEPNFEDLPEFKPIFQQINMRGLWNICAQLDNRQKEGIQILAFRSKTLEKHKNVNTSSYHGMFTPVVFKLGATKMGQGGAVFLWHFMTYRNYTFCATTTQHQPKETMFQHWIMEYVFGFVSLRLYLEGPKVMQPTQGGPQEWKRLRTTGLQTQK